MKSRTVETITNNEEHVRLRIYDGDIPADEATAELLRIEKEQRRHERDRHHNVVAKLRSHIETLEAPEVTFSDDKLRAERRDQAAKMTAVIETQRKQITELEHQIRRHKRELISIRALADDAINDGANDATCAALKGGEG